MSTRIYCPLCTWAPGPHDRWVCAPGCLTVWNTFETRARCPGCAKQWRFTACHACRQASPHEEWYHDDAADDADARADARPEREREAAPVGVRVAWGGTPRLVTRRPRRRRGAHAERSPETE